MRPRRSCCVERGERRDNGCHGHAGLAWPVIDTVIPYSSELVRDPGRAPPTSAGGKARLAEVL